MSPLTILAHIVRIIGLTIQTLFWLFVAFSLVLFVNELVTTPMGHMIVKGIGVVAFTLIAFIAWIWSEDYLKNRP